MTVSVWLHTFGCKANQYDTEVMRQELESRGAGIVADPAAADAAVLNTCTVTNQADANARALIRRLHRRHPALRIVVAGCSTALRANDYRSMPMVSGVVVGHDPGQVAAVAGLPDTIGSSDYEPVGGPLLRANRRGTRGWLKIQDGCDRRCSFCATRLARSSSRSRPLAEVTAEARVQSSSHSELVLTGIHIGHYGRDLDPPSSLSRLCAELLEQVPGVRFRLGSIEATEVDDLLISLMETSDGMLAPHLHMPLQSGSDAVLRRMRRWHTREQYRRRALEIAARIPVLGLGADVIVGFPGETGADHAQTAALLSELPFTYAHVFPFSVRTGTAAASIPERVPGHLAAGRSLSLRELVRAKGEAHALSRLGGGALIAVEANGTGLTGDYLRVRVQPDSGSPGSLARVKIGGSASGLVAHAPGARAALPILSPSGAA
ncbi:MAG: MiaB/RimO family radical SAM methylthiotransferase [Gemmatimonadota bacterium]